MIKCVSFDLQGVLSASEFSDNFWLELLPQQYARCHKVSLAEAKAHLRQDFTKMGKYDIRYYDNAYWAELLKFDTLAVIQEAKVQPVLNRQLLDFIANLPLPKIIISTTTKLFIDYELGVDKALFVKAYSCVDDFKTGGKTPEVFERVALEMDIKTSELLHVGDNGEMDVVNAQLAGVRTILYDSDVDKLVKRLSEELSES